MVAGWTDNMLEIRIKNDDVCIRTWRNMTLRNMLCSRQLLASIQHTARLHHSNAFPEVAHA